MPKPIDLSAFPGDEPAGFRQSALQLRNVPTDKILDELLRRDCVDFSKVALHMRMAFLYLFLALVVTAQVRRLVDGYNPLECLLP